MGAKTCKISDLLALRELLCEEAFSGIVLFYLREHPPSEQALLVCQKLAAVHPELGLAEVELSNLLVGRQALAIAAAPIFWLVAKQQLLYSTDVPSSQDYVKAVDIVFKPEFEAEYASSALPLQPRLDEALDEVKHQLSATLAANSFVLVTRAEKDFITPSAVCVLLDNSMVELARQQAGARRGFCAILEGARYAESDSLAELLAQDAVRAGLAEASSKLEQRITRLVNSAPVFLLIKGSKTRPFCRFSRAIVELFNDEGVAFEAFDVLSNNCVREHVKRMFDWNTFPQVYVRGQLVGGLDVLRQMIEEKGSLRAALNLEQA